jgi:hypothetical protein
MLLRRIVKWIFIVLVVFSIFSLIVKFGQAPFYKLIGVESKAGIKISALPEAQVLINGNQVGTTPFTDENLIQGDYEVKLVKDNLSWQGNIKLTSGTITVVNRELAEDRSSSSGETLTLYPGQGLVLISNPVGADVSIDDKDVGKTPITLNDVSIGEHNIVLKSKGYITRSIRATLPDKLQLVISSDLAISEADLNSLIPIPTIQVLPRVTVLQTPTGFLRVRDKPNLNGAEIGRVNPGDTLDLIEEDTTTGWDKVKLPDGKEGYVSSSYVQKKS